MQAPKIDSRTYPDIVAETEALARDLLGWQPRADVYAAGELDSVHVRARDIARLKQGRASDRVGTDVHP